MFRNASTSDPAFLDSSATRAVSALDVASGWTGAGARFSAAAAGAAGAAGAGAGRAASCVRCGGAERSAGGGVAQARRKARSGKRRQVGWRMAAQPTPSKLRRQRTRDLLRVRVGRMERLDVPCAFQEGLSKRRVATDFGID